MNLCSYIEMIGGFYKNCVTVMTLHYLSVSLSLAQSDLTQNLNNKEVASTYSLALVKMNKPGVDKSSLEKISKSTDFFFRISTIGPEGFKQSVVFKSSGRDVIPKWSTYSYDDFKLNHIHSITEAHEVKFEDVVVILKAITTSKLWSLGEQEERSGGPVLTSVSGVRIEMSHKGKYKELYYFQPELSENKNDKIFVSETQKILKSLNFKVSSYLFNLDITDEVKKIEKKEISKPE